MIIAVHDGGFHCDDAFSIALLKLIYSDINVIRTRDPEQLKKADMRIDVGRKYDPKTQDFDHHQQGFKEQRKNGIPYASAGLIWKHFGEKLINSKEAFEYIDNIMQQVDADDSGISLYQGDLEVYSFNNINDAFAPNWKAKIKDFDKAFNEEVNFITILLKKELEIANGLKEAKKIIEKALSDKEYIILDIVPNLWWDLMLDFPNIKFVIFQQQNGTWISTATRVKKNSFENKKPFPKQWADLTADALSKLTGVKDALYCHKKRFIAVAKSKEGIIKLTELALKN